MKVIVSQEIERACPEFVGACVEAQVVKKRQGLAPVSHNNGRLLQGEESAIDFPCNYLMN